MSGKEMTRTSKWKTQYLANILPYQWKLFLFLRVRPASIRHNFPRQGNSLPINITNSNPQISIYKCKKYCFTSIYQSSAGIRLAKFEMAQFVWKTNGLPLTYSRFIRMYNFRSTLVRTEKILNPNEAPNQPGSTPSTRRESWILIINAWN